MDGQGVSARVDQPRPHEPGAKPSCPNCGTPRVGFFRLCRSCGFEFEATDPQTTIVPAFRQAGSSDASVTTTSAARSAVLPMFQHPVEHRFEALIQLLGAVLAAALIGAIVPLILWAIQG